MDAELRYVGRALVVRPAAYGELLESACSVMRYEMVREWVQHQGENGETYSVLETRRQGTRLKMYWYQTDKKGERVFCAYSGYGPRIKEIFDVKNISCRVLETVDDGLGEPDLSKAQDVVWRTGQRKVFAKLLAYRRGRIVCPTGFGKSFLARQLAGVYPNADILITVSSRDVAETMYNELRAEMGPRQVGMVGGGRRQPKRVTVALSQSLHHCSKDVNIVLADECHELVTDRFIRKFNSFHRARLFGFTASPDGRSDGADALGEALFGPVLIDITYSDAVDGGNIVPITVRAYNVTRGPEVSAIQDKAKADRLGLWTNAARNTMIAQVVRELELEMGPDAQILVMVDKTEHAYCLGQLLDDFTIVTGEPDPARVARMQKRGSMLPTQDICTAAMRNQYRLDFEANRLKRAIATKVWKQGVDFKDLAVLVRADGTGSTIHSIQVPGRLSRLGKDGAKERGILVDFIDRFSKNLLSRSNKRLASYRKSGWSIETR